MLPYLGQEELDDALCWVAEKGHAPLVSVLLEKSTASPSAIESIRYKLMGQISGGSSALTLAVKSMKPASVRMLLDKGADVHSTKQSDKRYEGFRRGDGGIGETALHALAKARITSTTVGSEILGLLLKAGANLEARDAKNNTPILLVSGLDPESNIVLKLLMAAGADVSAENAAGDTLLLRACQLSPSTKLAEMLLGYGADPKKPRLWDGATPIHR